MKHRGLLFVKLAMDPFTTLQDTSLESLSEEGLSFSALGDLVFNIQIISFKIKIRLKKSFYIEKYISMLPYLTRFLNHEADLALKWGSLRDAPRRHIEFWISAKKFPKKIVS